MSDSALVAFLADDRAMELLKAIDKINPIELPENKLSSIKEVSDVLGWSLRDTWKLIDKGVTAKALAYHGGILSRKKVDLTDLGEDIVDAEGTEDLRNIIRGYNNG